MLETQSVSMFDSFDPRRPIGIIPTPGAEELGQKINDQLIKLLHDKYPETKNDPRTRKSLIIDAKCPRFGSGDGKCVIGQSVRGYDLYLIADVGNYGYTYKFLNYPYPVPMSPDEHFADLKRLISAVGGMASHITVIMPLLYGGRQHKRTGRESLDCAMALQELQSMGVSNIITFDAHDPRVQNAVPLMGFDNVMPTYQVLKAMMRNTPDLRADKEHMMIVSPDEGAMDRNMYYASVLGIDLGMFYKRRDYSTMINGRHPIVSHEYLGNSVEGKDIFVADDIISSGDSMLRLAYDLKEQGCKRIFMFATYALFTEGLDRFNKAYEEGMFDCVLSTNLTYRTPELLAAPWYTEVDATKYAATFIFAMHQNQSVSSLIDPHKKIAKLLEDTQSNN